MSIADKMKNAKVDGSLFAELPPQIKRESSLMAQAAYKIFETRTRMGMNQAEFAKRCGVTQSMISKWESGEYNFSLKVLEEIKQKCGVQFDITDYKTALNLSSNHYTGVTVGPSLHYSIGGSSQLSRSYCYSGR